MIAEHTQGALTMAGAGMMGLVAQATVPLPHDFQTWPVTAILAFLVLVAFGIIGWQIQSARSVALKSCESAIEQAKAMCALADALNANNQDLREATAELRLTNGANQQLITEMRIRPCIGSPR